MASKSERRMRSVSAEPLHYEPGYVIEANALLPHRVTVADGDRALGGGLAVHRDAERRAGLVHPTIPPSDGAAVVIKRGNVALEIVVEGGGQLGHAVLLDQREDPGLDRCHGRMEAQNHAGLAL